MASELLGRLVSGAAAGAVGLLAMDLVWYARYRKGGGEDGFTDWALVPATASWEDVSPPGEVVHKAAATVGLRLPETLAGPATNAMHWLTGVGYGLGHSLVNHRRGALRGGILTGLGAVGTSYGVLGTIGVYQPVWEYDRRTLGQDVSAHLVFGLTTSVVYRALRGA